MARNAYVGVNGSPRKVKNMWVGVNGTPRKVKRGWVGVNGTPKLFFSNFHSMFNITGSYEETDNGWIFDDSQQLLVVQCNQYLQIGATLELTYSIIPDAYFENSSYSLYTSDLVQLYRYNNNPVYNKTYSGIINGTGYIMITLNQGAQNRGYKTKVYIHSIKVNGVSIV